MTENPQMLKPVKRLPKFLQSTRKRFIPGCAPAGLMNGEKSYRASCIPQKSIDSSIKQFSNNPLKNIRSQKSLSGGNHPFYCRQSRVGIQQPMVPVHRNQK